MTADEHQTGLLRACKITSRMPAETTDRKLVGRFGRATVINNMNGYKQGQPIHTDAAPKSLVAPGRSRSVAAMAPVSSRTAATLTAQNRSAPTLALSVEQACEALGVSWDTWRAHIEPDVRLVRLGRRKLIPVSELHAWLDRHAESVAM